MSLQCHVMSCDMLAHDVISCRFMEDHSTSSLIWNYKVVYRVLQTCSELPSLGTIHRILSFTEVVHTMCSMLYWLASHPQTREELREALENEIRSFTVDKVSWRPPVLASSRGLPTIEFWITVVYCKQSKTGQWEGLGMLLSSVPIFRGPGYTWLHCLGIKSERWLFPKTSMWHCWRGYTMLSRAGTPFCFMCYWLVY